MTLKQLLIDACDGNEFSCCYLDKCIKDGFRECPVSTFALTWNNLLDEQIEDIELRLIDRSDRG